MSVTQIKNTSFFQPTAVTGCQLWLDGADTSSLVLSGSNVTQWNDKSGNGYSMTNNAGTTTLATASLNSLTTVYTPSGTNTRITNFVGRTKCTMFIVAKAATSRYLLALNGGFLYTANDSLLYFQPPAGNYLDIIDSVGLATPVVSNNTWFILCIGYDNATSNTANPYTINGTTRSTVIIPRGTPGILTDQNITSTFYINSVNGTNSYDSVYTAEILYYNNTLTTAQRQQIEAYLAWKWGLQQSLPSTHPFARTPSFATALYFPKAVPKITGTSGKHPVSIAGLQLWLDAADTTTLTVSGSNVSSWRDKSGNNNNATQPTLANQPTIGTLLNGLNVLDFTGTQPYFSFPTISFTNITVFTIFRNTTLRAYCSPLFIGPFFFFFTDGAGNNLYGTGRLGINGEGIISQAASGITTTNYLVYSLNLTVGATDIVNFYINGTNAANFNGAASGGRSYYQVGSTDSVGATTGFTAEILVYNGVLNNSQRQEVEGYLAWKWGLQSSLAAGHSYQTLAPIVIPYVNPVVRRIITIDSPIRIITSGLVSRWQLNESSGSTVIDSVGGNNITIGGSPSRVSVTYGSYTGYALSLQTTSQVGSIGLPSNMNVTAHSITSWVYFTAIRSGSQQRWLSWGNSGCGGGGQDFATYLDSIYSGPTCIVAYGFLNSGLTTGVWYFCTSTYNGTTWTTYLNGTQVQTANAGLSAVNGFFSIGYNRDSAQTLGGNGGGGYLGEIRFYNRALTASEVLQIYQRTG